MRLSGSTSGMWKRSMAGIVRHRQTKGPDTDRPSLNHRATSRLYAPVSACINCHGVVKLQTRDLKDGELVRHVNPHDSHLGEVSCTMCHKMHQPSVLYCNDCHKYEQRVP
jgi:nitrate/TMAO reductase-like tetraheme cytochrome c subunit